jgi:hypothetical protein
MTSATVCKSAVVLLHSFQSELIPCAKVGHLGNAPVVKHIVDIGHAQACAIESDQELIVL